jgi:GTP-binding protein
VGKSTLFNRLSRSRAALVDDSPGVTRDRLYARIEFEGIPLTIIDTGGFDDLESDPLRQNVREQVQEAIREADRIIFMVDGRQGILPVDEEIADYLRRSRKPVFPAVNKVDGPEHDHLIVEFFNFGWQAVYPLSAAHGYGVQALMLEVTKDLPQSGSLDAPSDPIRVAVLGKPNVGKSSLVNRLLGAERVLVNASPGTTRDAVDTLCSYRGREYLLIDTAGIRRRARVKQKIEKFSVLKSLRSLARCHVAVILLDAGEGVAEQDARICGYALEKGKGIILAANKWDLIKNDSRSRIILREAIRRQLKFISFVPRINLSALSGERVMKLFDLINKVHAQSSRKITTAALNKALQEIIDKHAPPREGRGRLKFFYAVQTGIRPPAFVLFVNRPELIHFSYNRFLANQLREHFDLDLVPLKLRFRKRRPS